MCCTAKKYEAAREEMRDPTGLPYVDTVITTRELAWMIRSMGLDFPNLPEGDFDHPLGESTGAGAIFGASGGVMEAAVRTAHFMITGRHLDDVEIKAVRGVSGQTKEATVDIDGTKLNVAVAHGLGNAAKLLEAVRKGEKKVDFIEIMGCPGGCIGGGGQPYAGEKAVPMDHALLAKRAQALYSIDAAKTKRRSYENEDIQKLYKEFLGEPGSHVAHELLHTGYRTHFPRGIIASRGIGEGQGGCIMPDDPRFEALDAFIESRKGAAHEDSELIPVLHKAQDVFGHIPPEVVEFVALRMNVPRSKVFGVATFYHYFSLTPRGQYRIAVCMGTACYVKGGGDIAQEFKRILGIDFGKVTGDGVFSLECARCIGACGQAPVVMVNDEPHTRMTVPAVQALINTYHERAMAEPPEVKAVAR
jgi:NADP-reducing hydrogenase subunit HndD